MAYVAALWEAVYSCTPQAPSSPPARKRNLPHVSSLPLASFCPPSAAPTAPQPNPCPALDSQEALDEVRKERAERAELGSNPHYTRIYV